MTGPDGVGVLRVRHPLTMQSVYEAAGGSEGLLRLADAWHYRVMADEIASHAFSHGFHPQHTARLAAYWAEALGGPTTYSDTYGDETSMVRIHSGNGPHPEMDRRAIACFDQALDDVGLTAEPLRQVLHDYFAWATTTTMSHYTLTAYQIREAVLGRLPDLLRAGGGHFREYEPADPNTLW
jgi:hemoglobin